VKKILPLAMSLLLCISMLLPVGNAVIYASEHSTQLTIKNATFTDLDGKAVTELAPWNDIVVEAEVLNHTSATVAGVFVVGLFDPQGVQVSYSYEDISLAAGASAQLKAGLKLLQETEGYHVRAFVWNSLSAKAVLSNVVSLPIELSGAWDLFVSPNGLESNPGTIDSPTTLASAITRIEPGYTIFVRGGTYSSADTIMIERGNSGTENAKKKIFAYGSEKPIFDFSSQPYNAKDPSLNSRGIQINGDHWHIKGLEVMGSADNGVFVAGNYNRIENLDIHHNRDSGLQISRHLSTAPVEEWPSYNEIINSYSHDNYDPDNGEDADGFAAKLTIGPGNVFDGCIAAFNTDDGWDLFAKQATGPIGAVTIKNSIAYKNGQTSEGKTTSSSDGNGFKLGGDMIAVNHIVINSIAFENKKHGFTWNSNPGSITMTNNTSWGNKQSNFAFDQGTHLFTNNLSYQGKSSDKSSGTDVDSSNVWWHNTKGSQNAKGLKANDADFVSLTPSILRNPDGSPNIGDFLKLAADSDLKGAGTPDGMDIGAHFGTSKEPTKPTPPKPIPVPIPTPVEGKIEFTKVGGWFETAYAEWKPFNTATHYNVYYKLKSEEDSAYQLVDHELVRNTRVDVLGLKGDTDYTIKVVAVKDSTEMAESAYAFDVRPSVHDRTGFAFSEHSPLGSTTGGYNLDGTVHEDARILYITDANKDTVTLDVVISNKGATQKATGLAEIFSLKQKKYDNEPLIVRIIGTVTSPTGLPNPETYNLVSAKRTNNITFEGVGEDARISGWGIEIREATNIEVRNLGFGDQPDDGVSIQTKNRNLWIHHNEYFWGKDMGGDKTKGDGSIDMKTDSSYITVAYNTFHDTGKGLAMGFDDPEQFYVTIHHNFFNASDSRHPRVTKASVHVFNNYFYDIRTYGVGAATNSNVFVENNYFEMIKRPMMISSQGHDLLHFAANHTESVWVNDTLGYRSNATEIVNHGNPSDSTMSKNDGGAIKQVGNYMDAYTAATFYEPIDTGNGGRGPVARPAMGWEYNNFDTSPIMYEYIAETAMDAKETVLDLAGRLGADNRAAKQPPTNQ
jgi:pectate lyase